MCLTELPKCVIPNLQQVHASDLGVQSILGFNVIPFNRKNFKDSFILSITSCSWTNMKLSFILNLLNRKIGFFFNFYFFHFSAAPAAYGSSQARGQLGAISASLHHNHGSTESEPHL